MMKNNSNSPVKTLKQKSESVHSITNSIPDAAAMDIIRRHLNSFQENDLEFLMSDYTEESVLVTQETTYTGVDNIRSFFVDLMRYFPKRESTFELDSLVVNNALVFIVWHAKTPTLEVSLGTDTFVIKNGKIRQQTFAGELKFL